MHGIVNDEKLFVQLITTENQLARVSVETPETYPDPSLPITDYSNSP